MTLSEIVENNRKEILGIAAKHGAYNVRIFGSVARGESNEQSDVDFLVDMEGGRSLMDLSGLIIDLEELLGRKVDVITEVGMSPYLKDRILSEARPL